MRQIKTGAGADQRSVERLLADLGRLLGPSGVVADRDVLERYGCDWTRTNACPPVAVARPRNTAEVSAVLAHCHASGWPVVVQGGLTGLAGGATPRPGELSLSLELLGGIETLDADAAVMTVRAGTLLAAVQQAAGEAQLAFPLDLASRGSCTIGGNIATNAGGNRVLRHGMTRNLVLGVEAVLADGTVLSSLTTMLKDNAGYDLKQLFIGTEGTLGIVTRAVLRLLPEPHERVTALVALTSFAELTRLLVTLRRELASSLSSFEAMWSDYFECALEHLALARPFGSAHPFYALVEIEARDASADRGRLESVLSRVLEAGGASDAVVANSLDESARLWRIREGAGELITGLAPAAAYDVSMPLAAMEAYVDGVRAGFERLGTGRPFGAFGHLGDGNLHLFAGVRSREETAMIDALVYGDLEGRGSVSAEHGIGSLKKAWLGHTRTAAEIAVMRSLKQHLDPRAILNPGRVI